MTAAASPATAQPSTAVEPNFSPAFSQALQTLLTPQADYNQKQAAWKQLREGGYLDQVIAEMERRTAEDPSDAVSLAVLGQAYLAKSMTVQDILEKGTWVMKADGTFDEALRLDPNNWEARFLKADVLSHFPPEFKKSPVVIENLVTLIEQQEAQSPQPQFAQTYILLGEQYQKAGYTDDARATWQRGATLFPDNDTLRQKLAVSP